MKPIILRDIGTKEQKIEPLSVRFFVVSLAVPTLIRTRDHKTGETAIFENLLAGGIVNHHVSQHKSGIQRLLSTGLLRIYAS
jgi:hypothetical protein